MPRVSSYRNEKEFLDDYLGKYQQWIIDRAVEGQMEDFSQQEIDRVFGEWVGYNLFCRLIQAMIDRGFAPEKLRAAEHRVHLTAFGAQAGAENLLQMSLFAEVSPATNGGK